MHASGGLPPADLTPASGPRDAVCLYSVCCTTVGESLSDQVNETAGLGLGITAAVFFPILFAATFIQMKVRRYYGIIYWVNVILMSICGTIATDGLHDDAGLELWIEVRVVNGTRRCVL